MSIGYRQSRGERPLPPMSATALAAALLLAGPPAWGQQNLPSGGQITAGSGRIAQNGRQLTVTQDSARMAADWQSFSVGSGWSVRFDQPSASSIALNRVLGPDPSTIAGSLSANGQVFLLNPNGVLFTPTAQVSVGGLVASTLNLSNADFLADRFRFDGESGAAVVNRGSLRADGTLALIAARIENTGTLQGQDVALGAGRTVTLDMGGPISLQIERGALEAQIANGGAILAGNTVLLSAKAAADLGSSVINHSGVIEAGRLAPDAQGRIVLAADQGSITLTQGSVTDASSQTGDGGTVLVGGGYQGREAAVPNAQSVTVEPGAQLRADAGAAGHGGTVVVWSDGTTRFGGAVNARGGAAGGDGGFAEVSGARVLDFQGTADLRAANGRAGTLLLDPSDITISNGMDDTSAASPFTGNSSASILNVGKLQTALAGGNVVVDAGGGSAAGGGSITVADAVSSASTNSLTLKAVTAIDVNAAVGLGGALHLSAGGGVSFAAPVTANGIHVDAGGSVGQTVAGVLTGGTGGLGVKTTAGNIALAAATNATAAAAFSAPGDVAYKTSSDMMITQVGALSGLTGQAVDLTTTGGATVIGQNRDIRATTLTLTTGAGGQVVLTNAGNAVDTVRGSLGAFPNQIVDGDGGLNVGPVTSAGNLGLVANGDLTVAAAVGVGANTLSLRSTSGNIVATAGKITAGTLSLETGAAGGANVRSAGHDVATVQTAGAGVGSGGIDFRQDRSGGTTIGSITSLGKVVVSTGDGPIVVNGLLDTSAAPGDGDIGLGAGASSLTLNGGINAGSHAVRLSAQRSVSQANTGAGISAGTLSVFSLAGDANLAPTGTGAADVNNVGTFAAEVLGGSLSYRSAGSFNVGRASGTLGIDASGAVSLQVNAAGGTVTQTRGPEGAIKTPTLNITTNNGNVTLSSDINDIASLGTVNLGNAELSVWTSRSTFSVGTVTANLGIGVLNVTGDLNTTGALTSAGDIGLGAQGGTLTLGGPVTSLAGSVTLRSRSALATGPHLVSAPSPVTGDVTLISDTSTVTIGAGGVTVGDTLGIQVGPAVTLNVAGPISAPNVTLIADQMDISAAVNATGAISLAPVTIGTEVTLGNTASPVGLVVDKTELGFLSAPTLNVGRSLGGGTVAGQMHIDDAAVGSGTLNLFSRSGMRNLSLTNGVTVGSGSGALNVTAGGDVELSGWNGIGSIGGSTTSGSFNVVRDGDPGPLTVNAVTTAGGGIMLRNFEGNLTVAGAISSNGGGIALGSNNGAGSQLVLQNDVNAGTGPMFLFASGGISQTAGLLTGAGLAVTNFSSGNIDLAQNNQVSGSVGMRSASGDISFTSAAGFTVGGLAPTVSIGAGIFAQPQEFTAPGAVTLGVGGSVVQSAHPVKASALNIHRLGATNPDVTLDLAANNVTTLGAVSLGTGALHLRDGDANLAVAGPVNAGGVRLQAHGDITAAAGATIATTGGGAIVLNADADASGQGAIALTGATLNSNGGAITLGGGANPLTTAAVGAADGAGIALSATTLSSGAGAITLLGTGSGTGHGVQLDGATSVTSTSGHIAIAGTAGGGAGSRDFSNSAGASAVSSTTGRWLIYTSAPGNNTYGGLLSGQTALYNKTFAGNPPAGITEAGNRYIFASSPGTLTVNGNFSDSKTYGDAYTAPTAVAGTHYTLTGFADASAFGGVFTQDTAANIGLSGAPTFTSAGDAAAAAVAGSPYDFSWSNGTLANTAGYSFGTPVNGGTLTVNPRPITVSSSTGQGKTYGADDPAGAATAYGVTTGTLALGQTLTGSMGRAAGETVGNYDFTRGTVAVNDGSGGANYTLTFDGTTNRFAIAAAPLTASIATPTKVYGADDPAVAGMSVTLGGTVQRNVRDLNGNVTAIDDSAAVATSLTALTRAPGEDVGSRSITGATFSPLTGAAAGNYTAPTSLEGPPVLTITAAPLSGSFASFEKTYGEADPSVVGTPASFAGLVNRTVSTWNGNVVVNDSGLSGVVTGARREPGEDVGSYAYTASFGVGSSNYSESAQNGAPVLTILPRPIALAAEPATKVYGDADPALTARITGGSLGAVTVADTLLDVTGDMTRTPGANVGRYDIQLGAGAKARNYTIAYDAANGAFSITPRGVAVTALGGSSTYGESPANPGLAAANLAAGDSVDALTGLANGFGIGPATPAGSHTVQVQGTLANPNYVLASTTAGQWVVLPKALSITAHDQTMTEGMPYRFRGNEFTAAGLVPGETIDTVAFASAALQPGTVAGTYAITPSAPAGSSGFAASNYAIRYVDGQMMVLRSPGLPGIIASTTQQGTDPVSSIPPSSLLNLEVVGAGIKLPAEAGGDAP